MTKPKTKPKPKRRRRAAFCTQIIPFLLPPPDAREEAQRRVRATLIELKKLGVSQARLAAVIGSPVQYICDVKNGRRTVTELFARRLQDVCGINYLWLLGSSNDQSPTIPGNRLTLRYP